MNWHWAGYNNILSVVSAFHFLHPNPSRIYRHGCHRITSRATPRCLPELEDGAHDGRPGQGIQSISDAASARPYLCRRHTVPSNTSLDSTPGTYCPGGTKMKPPDGLHLNPTLARPGNVGVVPLFETMYGMLTPSVVSDASRQTDGTPPVRCKGRPGTWHTGGADHHYRSPTGLFWVPYI